LSSPKKDHKTPKRVPSDTPSLSPKLSSPKKSQITPKRVPSVTPSPSPKLSSPKKSQITPKRVPSVTPSLSPKLSSPKKVYIAPKTPTPLSKQKALEIQKATRLKPRKSLSSPSFDLHTSFTTSSSIRQGRAFQVFGQRDHRSRGSFRNNFQRNIVTSFVFLPIIIEPFYSSNTYYTEPSYSSNTYYTEPFYSPNTYYTEPSYSDEYYLQPYYEPQPYDVEEPYRVDRRDSVDLNIQINQPSYTLSKDSEQDYSLETQQRRKLLQTVLQAMKIFDIPQFYNKPELSILRPASSE
jgi:hypothetical protein